MQSKNLKADNYFNDNRSNLQMFIEKFLVGGSQKRQGFFFFLRRVGRHVILCHCMFSSNLVREW